MYKYINMLRTKIEQSRNIKSRSLDNYMWSLNTIYTALNTKQKFDSLNWLGKKEEVVLFLERYKPNTRKNFISAIVVALSTEPNRHKDLMDYYKVLLDSYLKQLNTTNKKQELTETQKENWTTMANLKAVAKSYKKKVNDIMEENEPLTKKHIATYQEYILSLLYTEMPPLRNDYANMIMIRQDELKGMSKSSNYLVNDCGKYHLVLNQYKTDKFYGEQIIKIPKKLFPVLNNWEKINYTHYFLINNKGNQLNANGLSKLLNKTFSLTGKKIGSGMIRHIYLSEKYVPNEKEKEGDAKAMLHSVAVQQGVYVKKIPKVQ